MPTTADPPAELLIELTRLGIELQADGDRLRYRPRSAMTDDLTGRVKVYKAELQAILQGRAQPEADVPEPMAEGQLETYADREIARFCHVAVARPDGRGWYDPAGLTVQRKVALQTGPDSIDINSQLQQFLSLGFCMTHLLQLPCLGRVGIADSGV